MLFLGSVDEATLHECYRSCDIFVLPSAQEGFGIVFLEAMRYRKPTVGARYGGIPEVVLDGITGLLVDYGDEVALAEAVTSLCKDPELRQRFGDAGYERLELNFTLDQFKERLSDILGRELPQTSNEQNALSVG